MRRLFVVSLLFTSLFALVAVQAQTQGCITIQDGKLRSSDGALLQTGFDDIGYNYQAHEFNGKYCDAFPDEPSCVSYPDDELSMKWNEAWLSNKDCTGDGLLDIAPDVAGTYRGTGAWITNHQKGTYLDDKGKKQRWEYFVKIVAAPSDATLEGGVWRAADHTEIGPLIWDDFVLIQEVYNDTGAGEHHALYVSPYSAGFGRFTPKR